MNNKEMFRGEEFSRAWHAHQRSKEDLLRTRILNPILERELGDLSGKKILDAGCGNGFFIPNLMKLNPKKVFACDISPFLINIVKSKNPQIETKVVDITQTLPYENNEFDLVLSNNVIMDVFEVDSAVKEMARVLRSGGEAHVVMVHTLYNLFFNDKNAQSETLNKRLERYLKNEDLEVSTIPGYDHFLVYRRPPSYYINTFVQNGLEIKKMIEIPINETMADSPKYAERMNAPVFMYFALKKP